MSLILIGTNHCDLRGPQRLLRYLQHYSPTHMIVEGHGELYPFAQPFLRPQARRALFFEHYPEFKENVKLNTLDAFLSSTGYEAAVSSLYADSHAVSLQYIDVPTDRLTSMIEDLALQEGYSTAHDHSTEALRELLALSPEEVFEFHAQYHRVQQLLWLKSDLLLKTLSFPSHYFE